MAFLLFEGAEPIAGYQLVSRLGTGGYGEVWKATAPGGLTKAIKVIYGHQRDARAEQELRALSRIKEVRHPFLLSLERFEIIEDQVFIVTELADASLMDRFEECRKKGLPGIPRQELLAYIRDTADALDYMNEQYGLQHLDIKPQNLLLVGGRIKIADFGLVKDLRGTSATATGGVTPLYASPEAFDGKVSRHSDQYSLAIVYMEMLTGIRPFPGKTALQLAAQHMISPPMLDPLPPQDRPIIARALAKVADQRFPSCGEMAANLPRIGPSPAIVPLPSDKAPPVEGAPFPADRHPSPPEAALGDEDLLALDTLVSADLTPKTPAPSPVTPKRPPPEIVRPKITVPRPPGDARLRPTLFLGLGGIAAWTLRRLRRRLHARFGHLTAVPVLRLLLVDSDRSELRRAQEGKPDEALDIDETLLLPLRRPEHYRAESRELLRWLDRRYLYGIPRSLLTEGWRPLGRLALVDNLPEFLARLQETLALLASPEAREVTRAASGLSIGEQTPRVCIISSVSGGTGSGMVLDAAYAVRQVLAELKFADDGLCGYLLHATSFEPTQRDKARINAFATLTELNHFSRPNAHYPGDPPRGLNPSETGVAPFRECYLVHLGDQIGEAEANAATDAVADYLYLDTATAAGGFFEQYRQNTHWQPSEAGETVSLRTFGLHHLSFPRYPLAEQTARLFCRHILTRWQDGPPEAPATDDMQAEALAQANTFDLDPDVLTQRFHGAIRTFWAEDPEAHVQKIVADLLTTESPGRRPSSAGEITAQVLIRIDELLGIPRQPGQASRLGPQSLEIVLRAQGEELKANLGRGMVKRLIELVEDPRGRMKAADAAASWLGEHFHFLIENTRTQLAGYQETRKTLAEGLIAGEGAGKGGGGARWLGLVRSQAVPATPNQKLQEYALLRCEEVVCEHTLELLRSLARRLGEFSQELGRARQKLAHFAETFAPDPSTSVAPTGKQTPIRTLTELLPDRAPTLAAAAEAVLQGLAPELSLPFDEKFQAEVLNPQGGLWGLVSRGREMTDLLGVELPVRAQTTILEGIKEIDAARLFLLARDEPGQAEQALKVALEAAQPRLAIPDAPSTLVLALPKGRAGATLREMLVEELPDLAPTVLESEGDVMICQEVPQLPLLQVAAALIENEGTYADLARKVMTRIDVAWGHLKLS